MSRFPSDCWVNSNRSTKASKPARFNSRRSLAKVLDFRSKLSWCLISTSGSKSLGASGRDIWRLRKVVLPVQAIVWGLGVLICRLLPRSPCSCKPSGKFLKAESRFHNRARSLSNCALAVIANGSRSACPDRSSLANWLSSRACLMIIVDFGQLWSLPTEPTRFN